MAYVLHRRSPSVLAALFFACSCGPTERVSPALQPGFHVSGGFLRDESGRALLLRGMNLAGAHKEAPYFSFQTLPDYARVRTSWGMNSVRFLVTWAAIEPQEGVYDDAYLASLARRIEWAKEAGLFVVLDMHQDVYGEGFVLGGGDGAPRWTCDEARYASFQPNPSQWYLNYLTPEVISCYDHFWNSAELRAHYLEAWRRVAKTLANADGVVVGFDPMNEPYWGSYSITAFEADVLQPFYEEVVAAVRTERPEWVAFTEPASSRNLGVPTGLTRMTFPNVVYAPHSYDRDAESGNGFDLSRRNIVLQNGAALEKEAQSLGAALWIGEYGGMASKPGIVDYMSAEYDAFAAVAAGTTYWAYDEGGGYSVLNADGSERPELLGALVRPWPERIAGDPVSYSFDPTTLAFTVRYRADRSMKEPTIISVPDRVYPTGFAIDCGGCASTVTDGSLSITTPPPGDVSVVTLTPSPPPP